MASCENEVLVVISKIVKEIFTPSYSSSKVTTLTTNRNKRRENKREQEVCCISENKLILS
jgi:uncharacterized membrane-anchored protein YitT (DUF2179 family)